MRAKESGALSGGAAAGITLGSFVIFCAIFRFCGDEKNAHTTVEAVEAVEAGQTELNDSESTGKTAEVVIAGEAGSSSEK